MTAYITTELLEREAADPSRLVIRLVPYGETAQTPQGTERFAPGAFKGTDISQVILESQRHNGDIVGVGEALEEREDGAYGVFKVSDTAEGRDLLKLVADKVISAASVAFKPITNRRAGDIIERVTAELQRVAIVPKGAYPSSRIVEVREDMTEEQATTVTPEVAPSVVTYDDSKLLERMDSQDEQLAKLAAVATTTPGDDIEVRDWADLFEKVQERPEVNDLLTRALADNTFAVSGTGLKGTANISKIVEPVAAKRRAINALGLGGLPPVGMSIDYIVFDKVASTGYQGLVDTVAEKVEINSGLHAWDPATKAILTFAGGSDNSWQLLQRSSPDFRTLLLRQYASEWAFTTNLEMVTVAEAGGTADTLTLNGADALVDMGLLTAKLIDQSVAIEVETGSPATTVLAATDVWTRIASNPNLQPPQYGTYNVPGVMSAATLSVNVSGLTITHEPQMTAGQMITSVGGGEAAEFREDFKGIATQDQVSKLGTDIAIWGLGVAVVYRAAAVYNTTVTLA